nr:hypothetical protein [uncultured Campylobacter sp.]
MKKSINYLERICTDMLTGRVLLHPILLTAAFLAAKFGTIYLMHVAIFEHEYSWKNFGEALFYMSFDFTANAYFIALCLHLLLDGAIKRSLAPPRAVLALLIVAACILGYLDADEHYQKEGTMFYFFAGSLIAICIYLLVAAIKLKRFLPVICALAYVLSYVFCVWIYFKIPLKSLYVIRALFLLCPLAWTFYFKYEFQKSLAQTDGV